MDYIIYIIYYFRGIRVKNVVYNRSYKTVKKKIEWTMEIEAGV